VTSIAGRLDVATDAQTIPKSVPVLLSLLAGYVDSCTFLALFGLFVAQVTGSFVLAGTQLVAHENGGLVKLTAIPTFFIACVVVTVMAGPAARRARAALAGALALETVLLGGLFVALRVGAPIASPNDAAAVCASLCGLAAMGVQSGIVRLLIKGAPSTNVMTTNTSQLAVDATELFLTARARRRAPDDAALAAEHAQVRKRFDRLWPVVLGFLAGTIVGALAFARFNVWCVLAAIALAGGLALWAGRRALMSA
jgi:uncharacterized membrane protein YoaK (UPF0700 family)